MRAKSKLIYLQKRIVLLIFLSRLFFILSLFTLIMVGCGKTEADYPGISIYKTNGDYFDLVDVGVKNGNIIWEIGLFGGQSLEFTDTDTVYKSRIRLANGYILDTEASSKYDAYLSLSFKEYYLKELKTEGHTLSKDTLRKYILDTNPYKEYYQETKYPQKYLPPNILNDTAEINTIIRNGELEKYFERIK